MKTILDVALLILAITTSASAAQVYGRLKENGEAVGQGVRVELQCGGASYVGYTNAQGSYGIFVPEQGKCSIRVLYKGNWTAPYDEVHSYADPVQFDFELVNSNNAYVLNRK